MSGDRKLYQGIFIGLGVGVLIAFFLISLTKANGTDLALQILQNPDLVAEYCARFLGVK